MDDREQGFDAATFARNFNHLSPDYGAHFPEIYKHMRAQCPVAHTDQLGGFWVLTRYADIMRVARDDETFCSRYGITITPSANADAPETLGPLGEKSTGPLAAYDPGPNGEPARLTTLPIDIDPPLHGPYRKAIDPLFSPAAVAELTPWVSVLTDQLIDDIIERGEGDFSRDLGTPLTSIYTMRAAGLPLEEGSADAWWMQSQIAGSSSVERPAKALSQLELRQRVAAEVARQRTHPVEGGAIAHLIKAEVEGRRLDDWEIEAYVWLLIAGGVDTTQACMGSSFVWLARNPERRRELAAQPKLMPHAIEEFLRVFTPQQALSRTVMRDVELGGHTLKRGERVLMCWVSGNMDEAEFDNPEEVDFDRSNKRHMAFGLGVHRCLGSNVARLEFRILFEQILKRLPDYRIIETGLKPSPVSGVVFGYEHVPFVFTPGARLGGPRIVG
jgi:cytochrome P450